MIRFMFAFENQAVMLPVNPEELTLSIKGSNKSVEVIKIGEVNILRERKLKTLDIKCFFPVDEYPPYVLTKGKFENPQFYIDFFNNIIQQKKPVLFTVNDTDISFYVSIEDFNYSRTFGTEDVYYNLSLKEYKNYGAERANIVEEETGEIVATVEEPETRVKTGFAIGDEVVVNGKYYYSSYGDNPSATFNNFIGKISHKTNTDRKYPYHITTLTGGYRGWVAENQLNHR